MVVREVKVEVKGEVAVLRVSVKPEMEAALEICPGLSNCLIH